MVLSQSYILLLAVMHTGDNAGLFTFTFMLKRFVNITSKLIRYAFLLI